MGCGASSPSAPLAQPPQRAAGTPPSALRGAGSTTPQQQQQQQQQCALNSQLLQQQQQAFAGSEPLGGSGSPLSGADITSPRRIDAELLPTAATSPVQSPTPSQSFIHPRRVGFAQSEDGDRVSNNSNDTVTLSNSNSSSFRNLTAASSQGGNGNNDANWQLHCRRMRRNPLVVGLTSTKSHRTVKTNDSPAASAMRGD